MPESRELCGKRSALFRRDFGFVAFEGCEIRRSVSQQSRPAHTLLAYAPAQFKSHRVKSFVLCRQHARCRSGGVRGV